MHSPEGLLQVPAQVTKVLSMARRSLRIVFDTQEGMNDEVMGKLMASHEKTGWLTFSPTPIDNDAIKDLPPVVTEEGERTPSQRLRACLYVLWEQKGKPDTFALFYASTMEKFITQIKEKLT